MLIDETEVFAYTYAGSMQIAACHLTEVKLWQLHRKFGYLSAKKLSKLLKRVRNVGDTKMIELLTTHCHSCQMYGKPPG